MDLELGSEYEDFAREVATFVAAEWPPQDDVAGDAAQQFRRKAIARHFIYRHIPAEFGGSGAGADPLRSRLVREAFARVGAPGELDTIGARMLAPTLVARGSEEQKRRFVEASILGRISWCQGYSEPGAGSDLAALTTRAVLDGDQWVINGQKVWTSLAHEADYMFLLARTEPDAPKHKGISYLLLDMKAPGITVRPLRQLSGNARFNQVFLDDVRTPADWIVGERGQGWSVSRTTLGFERATMNPPEMMQELLSRLKDHARTTLRDGRPLIEDDRVLERFGEIEGHVLAHRYSVMRQVSMDTVGQNPGLATMVNKLYGTDIGLAIAALAQDLTGADSLLMPDPDASPHNMDWPYWLTRSLGMTIAGGTSNIQRNIIAERGLGLPRDGAEA